jgi:hydroxymethylpyrimidine/phosphomethylpyrimidine kinase
MIAKGGAPLLQPDAVAALKERLIPRATLLTPNIPEAEALLREDPRVRGSESPGVRESDAPIRTIADMKEAANRLLALGPKAVLLKGGHLEGEAITDILIGSSDARTLGSSDRRIIEYSDTRIPTRHTHGTGCTLASAAAAGIAQGMALPDAVKRARDYVRKAIETAPGLGKGHGPLNHFIGGKIPL